MTRVLMLAERFPPDIGGVATSAGRMARSLAQLGLTVDVLVWSRYLPPGTVQAADEEAPNVYRVGLYRHWDMSMLHTLNVLEWLHQTRSYAAVWGHYLFPAGFLAVWFARSQGLPSVVAARGNDVDREMFPPGDFARLQWTLQHATQITAVSANLAQKMRLLVNREAITVLPNVVDTDCFAPVQSATARDAIAQLRDQLGIAPNEIVLGFSGELREKKGQRFLFPALTRVRQHHPACLLIIGEIRAAQEPLLHLYANEHPDDAARVIVTGHLTDPKAVAQHLHLCDLLLQPSLWDGMPNALLEGMACGVGCLASDAGGIPEVLTHGETGLLLPRHQLHHLGDAILEWLDLPKAQRETMQKQARDRIRQNFSLAQEQQRLQQLMTHLWGDRAPTNESA